MSKKFFAFVCLLLLPFAAHSKDVYHIHNLSERELNETYTSILRDSCHHADKFWHDWPADTNAGYWGQGRNARDMNEGIRIVAAMTLTCGSVLKFSDVLTPAERTEYTRKAVAAIRYSTETHVTGPMGSVDGKPWGNSWQSAMWTADLSFGAWLIWDKLDPDLRKDLERVLAFEADRFLTNPPPAGAFNDTKAEENGWDLTGIAMAATLFPNNPHAAAWNEKAIEYMMNTLSAPQDQEDHSMVDGKPVNQWFVGANVHPDFTLENHGFFHPGYVGCSSYFLTETAAYYTYAHQPVPQAVTHHLMDVWRMFQRIILPDGEAACPQGMDWELHGLPYITLFAALANYQHDALAAHMEKTYVQYMRQWQEMCHGDLAVFGSPFGFPRHAVCSGLVAAAYAEHNIFGPPVKPLGAREAAAAVKGIEAYDWIEVIQQRTDDKFVSFSWTNRIMGMAIPLGAHHEGEPDFTVPMINGFIGTFDLAKKTKAKTAVVHYTWKKNSDGFDTSGELSLNGGQLKQALKVTSIGDKTIVYQDRVTAAKDVTVQNEHGFPLGIENDEVTGSRRHLTFENGSEIFSKPQPRKPFAISGSWANVDGRLGVVMAAGDGMNYSQATGYSRGISVCTDILYGSSSNKPRSFKAGEEVAHRVAIVFTEVTPKETAKLAQSWKIVDSPGGRVLRFKLPEGSEAEVPLL